jgi:HK97 family phage portal protein
VKLFGRELSLSRRAPSGLSAVSDSRGGWWPWIREPFTGAWQRNQEWTTDTALAHHAVYACITRIAQDIGKLRPKLVEKDANDIWTEIENAAHSPSLRKPNRFQNHIQFKEWWAASKLIRGNTYVLIERDLRGVPSAFYVLDPSRVQVLVAPDGEVFYQLQTDNLAGLEQDRIAVPASEIIHDRMNCLYHPLVGTSPIFACGTAANMGLQIQQNSSAFFANGSNLSGVLTTAQPITPEKALELSDMWNARYGKDKSGGVAVLGGGLSFQAMRMTATDAQLIDQLKWTAETVCSTFHVPPWKVGIGPMPAYTKPEIANQAYYSDCLQSHIEAWELCMDQAFDFATTTTEGRWLGIELDLTGLFRMDQGGQIESLAKAVGGSLLAPNEARKQMDQKPLAGGDSIYLQQQYYSLEALSERDSNDPFATPTPALPAAEPQKQLPAGEPDPAAARDATFGFLVRDTLAAGFATIASTLDAQRSELLALRSELDTRALPAPEPVPAPEVVEYVTEQVAASEERSTALTWLVREMDKTFASITESTNELRGELGALRTEMQTRSAQVAIPEPEPVVVVEPEDDAVEMWDGWFARDALAMVREAQTTQLRVVDDIDRQQFAQFSASTRSAIETLTATVQTLAARETVVHVEAPQVHVAPTTVNVESPDVHVTMPSGKTVTRTSKVVRDDVGALVAVETTEETA